MSAAVARPPFYRTPSCCAVATCAFLLCVLRVEVEAIITPIAKTAHCDISGSERAVTQNQARLQATRGVDFLKFLVWLVRAVQSCFPGHARQGLELPCLASTTFFKTFMCHAATLLRLLRMNARGFASARCTQPWDPCALFDATECGPRPLAQLRESLESLAADVAKEVEVQGRPARRPRKRLPMQTRSSEQKDLTLWEDSPAAVYNPSQGMLVLQQEQWHERLTHDRVLDWSGRLRAQKAKLQALAVPPEEPAPPAVKLPLPVVQEVFDSLVKDPQDEIQARLESKRQESLALQLELILANPPLLLQKAMKTAGPVKIRIAKVEASGPEDGSYIVYFHGCDSAPRVERRLKRAASVLASALARRLLLGYVRDLTFVPVAYSSENQDAPSGTLWRSRRRVRKQQVVSAAESWTSSMHF
ncbi:TCF25 [Symbiodinium sp. CCMP2456]|nr:TCF25 [Symbiodinium sp. CCMP2456]